MRKNVGKTICLVLLLFALVGLSRAQNILWVSNCWTETTPHDQGYVDLLTAQGYTVDRWTTTLMGTPPQDITAAAVLIANTYDLVIVGRHGGAGYNSNCPGENCERDLWNSITAPLIAQGAYNTRRDRWGWLDSTGITNSSQSNIIVVDGGDPVFAGVTPDENGEVSFVTSNVSYVSINDAGNGSLVASVATGTPRVAIARWETGMEFYTGAGDFAGGPRMAFHGANAGSAGGGDGTFNLTGQGTLMFLNAVYELSGATFDRPPVADAGPDRITNVGIATQLDGTGYDAEGTPTVAWSQLSGPGVASISDPAVEDPTVTFSAEGTYTLQIEVNDGVNAALTDTVTVYVRDPANDTMLARWDFESIPDPNSLTDVTGNGFTGLWTSTDGGDPNVAVGILNGGTSQAFDGQFKDGYWEVPNTLDAVDPNFYGIQTGNTFAAWVKVDPDVVAATNFPVIAAYDTSSARFQLQNTRAYLSIGSANVEGTRDLYDNLWHHVVGVYDGVNSTLSIYVDGVEDKDPTVVPSGTLCGVGLDADPDNQLRIGNREADRPFHGQIDDIQVYNYPLSLAEIATLTDAGDVPVYVTAGEDQTIYFKNLPVDLDGTLVVDDGKPADATLEWTLTTVPAGADANFISINSPTTADTTVTFPSSPVEGDYTFTLTGDDTATTSSDSVVITMIIPTCADVIADGLTNPMDFNTDCKVDILDFAAFAAEWLDCVDPKGGVGCVSPY